MKTPRVLFAFIFIISQVCVSLAASESVNVQMPVTIVDAETGASIPGSYINYYRKDYASDEQGVVQMLLKIRRHGTYFYVRAEGYTPRRVSWKYTDPADYPDAYTVKMRRGVKIGGRVVNEDREPVSGATVYIIGTDSSMGADVRPFEDKAYVWEETAVTDADGRWHYDLFPADRDHVSIRIAHSGYANDDRFHSDHHFEIYKNGSAISVLKKANNITGHIVDFNGDPVVDAAVFAGEDRFGSNFAEVTSGLEGLFVLPLSGDSDGVLTVVKAGLAPELVTLDDREPLEITLRPGHTVELTVLDPEGRPVDDAWVLPDSWRKVQGAKNSQQYYRTLADISRATHGAGALRYNKHTDRDGTFRWTWAPEDTVKYSVGKSGYIDLREVELSASENKKTVILYPELSVSGRVIDKETGEAIPSFSVTYGMSDSEKIGSFINRYPIPGKDGQYRITFNESSENYWIKIDAKGYASAVSRLIKKDEHQVNVDFALESGPVVSLLVKNPDGSPAADAEVWISIEPDPHFIIDVRAELPSEHTDSRGMIVFNKPNGSYGVMAKSPRGTGFLSRSEIEEGKDLQINAWSAVDITVINTNGDPLVNVPVMVHSERTTVMMDTDRRTDENGVVRFPQVPPGVVLVGFGKEEVDEKGRRTSMTYGNMKRLRLEPGKTTSVTYRQ